MVESDLKHQIYSSALDNWQKSNLNDCIESISIVSLHANETKDKIQQIMVCHFDHNIYAEGITMEYPLKLCLPFS